MRIFFVCGLLTNYYSDKLFTSLSKQGKYQIVVIKKKKVFGTLYRTVWEQLYMTETLLGGFN